MSIFRARGLRICLLGPAAVIVTALAIALAPPTANVIAATNTATCSVSDAAITWGVKESLRSYISGTIAHGEWTVSDGASYSTPNFGWSDGAGALNAGRGTLTFDGTLRFTGHDGILDTTLSNLALRFDASTTAELLFDVTGTTQDGTPVDKRDVRFATISVTESRAASASGATDAANGTEGTVHIVDAQATLTADGSDAFGTYPAGETLDPITITFSASDACFPEPTSGTNATLGAIAIAGAAVGLAALIVAGYLIRRRIRNRDRV